MLEESSMIGLLGVFLLGAYFITVFSHPNKHFSFHDRLFQSEIVNKRIYGELAEIGYMIGRFIVFTFLMVLLMVLLLKI